MTERERLLRESLLDSVRLSEKAAHALGFTHGRIGNEVSIQDLASSEEGRERLDTLTSRFARLADLLTQQVFRLRDSLDYLEEGSLVDRLNRAEKRGWIDSAETWKRIRELRNRVAHEYAEAIWLSIVRDVYRLTPALLECVARMGSEKRS